MFFKCLGQQSAMARVVSHLCGICFRSLYYRVYSSHLTATARVRFSSQADLRKDGRTGYHIPYGDWFSLLSCPHFFAEVLIYLSLCIIGASGTANACLPSVLLVTVANLASTAVDTHRRYKEMFRDYPRDRKAIIPFLL